MSVNELRNNLNMANQWEDQYETVYEVQKCMLATPTVSLNDSQSEWVQFAREDKTLEAQLQRIWPQT